MSFAQVENLNVLTRGESESGVPSDHLSDSLGHLSP